jgi:hypothetical protein
MSRLSRIPLITLALAALAAGGCGDDDEPAAQKSKPAAAKQRDLPVQGDFPVVPGVEYTSTRFEPKVTLSVPDGAWRTLDPESRDHITIDLTSDGTFNLAGFGLHRMTKVADPQRGAQTVADAVDAPPDYIEWLAEHPRLEASEPKDVQVGDLKGRQIEVSPKSFPKRRPAGCKEEPPYQPCLVLYFMGAEPTWFYKSGRIRFTALDVGGEQIIAEEFVDPDERFAAIDAEKLEPIVSSLRFNP